MTLLAMQDQIMPALGRVRSILYEVQVQTEQTAIEHKRMAAWHTKRGEQAAARMERRAAAVQQQRLADLDAAFGALQKAISTALGVDS
jgi:trehalose-6-phosphatase